MYVFASGWLNAPSVRVPKHRLVLVRYDRKRQWLVPSQSTRIANGNGSCHLKARAAKTAVPNKPHPDLSPFLQTLLTARRGSDAGLDCICSRVRLDERSSGGKMRRFFAPI